MYPRRDDSLIGVSPAYFISRYSDRFTTAEVAKSLADIAKLGCNGFQLEVYHREMLGEWLNGGAQWVRQQSMDLDLAATQFVAHFMMNAFADMKSLNSGSELEDMQMVLEIVSRFNECRTITIPLGAFEPGLASSRVDYRLLFERCSQKISGLLEMVEKSTSWHRFFRLKFRYRPCLGCQGEPVFDSGQTRPTHLGHPSM
jgi:hypothetical protein